MFNLRFRLLTIAGLFVASIGCSQSQDDASGGSADDGDQAEVVVSEAPEESNVDETPTIETVEEQVTQSAPTSVEGVDVPDVAALADGEGEALVEGVSEDVKSTVATAKETAGAEAARLAAAAENQARAAGQTAVQEVEDGAAALAQKAGLEDEAAALATAAANRVIATGGWTKKSQKADGTWTIAVEDGVGKITLSDDFSTRNAPDLKIFLSPLSASDVTASTAVSGSAFIGPLQSNKGAQSYTIPADIDVSAYRSILIHCEQYTKLWVAADIN